MEVSTKNVVVAWSAARSLCCPPPSQASPRQVLTLALVWGWGWSCDPTESYWDKRLCLQVFHNFERPKESGNFWKVPESSGLF